MKWVKRLPIFVKEVAINALKKILKKCILIVVIIVSVLICLLSKMPTNKMKDFDFKFNYDEKSFNFEMHTSFYEGENIISNN